MQITTYLVIFRKSGTLLEYITGYSRWGFLVGALALMHVMLAGSALMFPTFAAVESAPLACTR